MGVLIAFALILCVAHIVDVGVPGATFGQQRHVAGGR